MAKGAKGQYNRSGLTKEETAAMNKFQAQGKAAWDSDSDDSADLAQASYAKADSIEAIGRKRRGAKGAQPGWRATN